jgi:hypothetical protein
MNNISIDRERQDYEYVTMSKTGEIIERHIHTFNITCIIEEEEYDEQVKDFD